jgi:hypothetical protein
MPESIIVPVIDSNYDLAYLSPLQAALAPYEVWWSLGLWAVFAFLLFFQLHKYLIAPYLHA